MKSEQAVNLAKYLPPGFTATRPIPAVCKKEGRHFIASAPSLGLAIRGMGGSRKKALRDLGVVTVELLEDFMESPDQPRVGQAEHCFRQITAAISPAG
jgi:hypothetical protein